MNDTAFVLYAHSLQAILKEMDKIIVGAMKTKGVSDTDRLQAVEALIRRKYDLMVEVEKIKARLNHAR